MFLFFRQKWRTTATNGATLCYMYGNCGLHAVSSLLNSSNRPVRWSKKCRWSLNHCKHTPGHLVLFFFCLYYFLHCRRHQNYENTHSELYGEQNKRKQSRVYFIFEVLDAFLLWWQCYFINFVIFTMQKIINENVWPTFDLHCTCTKIEDSNT